MKRILSFILIAVMLCGVIPAKAEETDKKGKYVGDIYVPYGTVLPIYDSSAIKATADKLFGMIISDDRLSPIDKEMADVKALYKGGHYLESLILYRNFMIDKLRQWKFEDPVPNYEWYNASNKNSWPLQYQTAYVIAGLMSPDEYNNDEVNKTFIVRGYPSFKKDYGGFLEPENMDFDKDSHIRWLEIPIWTAKHVPSEPDSIAMYMSNLCRLGAVYSCTGNEVLLKRFIQLFNDYSCNYVDMTNALVDGMSDEAAKEYAKYTDQRVWKYKLSGYNAAGRLQSAGECEWYTGTLTAIAKGLPDPKLENQYSDSSNVNISENIFTNKLPEESYDLIDPVRWGNICYHLAKNETFRLSSYFEGGAIGNQMTNGMTGMLRYLCMFRYFDCVKEMEDDIVRILNETYDSLNQPDGGYLEISVGYNGGDYELKKKTEDLIDSIYPDIAENFSLTKSNLYFERLNEMYTSPVNVMTNYGNGYTLGCTPYWKDKAAAEKLDESRKELQKNKYTSAYLPYSGYGSMRSDWSSDSLYMSFFNYNRRNNGHNMTGTGAVSQLTAYKRPLILSGGTHYYEGPETMPTATELQDKFYELNGYLKETSTKKWSTVIVNGKSQAGKMYNYNSDGSFLPDNTYGATVQAVDNKIVDSRWVSNDKYDFAESSWNYGYSLIDTEYEQIDPVKYSLTSDTGALSKDAVHNRKMIFVKDAGLWVIADDMENTLAKSKENTYSQIWNLPAYDDANPNYLSGFKDEQVILEPESNTVHTNDEGNPNIYINTFSAENREYKKYSGCYEQGKMGIGWIRGFKNIEMGTFGPRTDIRIEWKDGGYGSKTQLATVLTPSKTEENPIKESKDLSDKSQNLTAFELVTKDGVKVKYQSTQDSTKKMVGNIEVRAKTLLTTEKPDGTVSGMVLDCSFAAVNKIISSVPYKSFTFTLSDSGAMTDLDEIAVPTTFDWVDYEDGTHVPVYSADEKKEAEEAAESANAYKDISGHWAQDIIIELYKNNIITPNEDKMFYPDEIISREDFVTMIVKALKVNLSSYNGVFEDINKTDASAKYIQTAYDMGMISGFDNKFEPRKALTREEMAKIIIEASKADKAKTDNGFTDWDSISDWAKEYAAAGKGNGILSGDNNGKFNPKNSLTRAEAAKCVLNIMN